MTKEELEKEATAYALKWGDKTDGTYACCRDGYLAGAEPRENRLAELEKRCANYEMTISKMEKGTCDICKETEKDNRIAGLEAQFEKMKWHKVADGDLPKDRHNVYVAYMNGYYQLVYTIASFRHKYWIINGLKTECEIIAWCELPKWEIKENDN